MEQWNGAMEWSKGMEQWNGAMELIIGMELEREIGIDNWSNGMGKWKRAKKQTGLYGRTQKI